MTSRAGRTIWFDVQDLLDYAALMRRPTGIQRLSLELYAAAVAAAPGQVGFVRHAPTSSGFACLQWQRLASLLPAADPVREGAKEGKEPAIQPAEPHRGALRRALRWMAWRFPERMRLPLGDAIYGQAAVFRHLASAARAAGRPFAPTPPVAAAPEEDLLTRAGPGDVLAAFGSPWSHADYAGLAARAAQAGRLRTATLIYDLIPLVRPDFYEAGNGALFARHMRGLLPQSDVVFAISEASVRDVVAWSAREGIALRATPRAIPIGTGFSLAAPAASLPAGLAPGGYALFVSTIEARKNHVLAFRAWRRLLDELGPERVPTLVFAGRIGWMVADLMQQIHNAAHLGGKLVLVENPDDATLAALYQGARFTLFPSLYEGWGLPVSESLAFGKVCLASNATSIPEAGGPFCLYHDPDSVTDATELYRRAITEPDLITSLETRIARDYQPTPWTSTANAVLQTLG